MRKRIAFLLCEKNALRLPLVLVYTFFCSSLLTGQIVNGVDTLYGNEWINTDNPHLRLEVSADGFYRVDYEMLVEAGWPVAEINSANFQLYHDGVQIPYYSSVAAGEVLQTGEYLLFYGEKNRGELDRHLYRSPQEQQLNPLYSLYSDKAAYFLSWNEEGGEQYATIPNDLTDLPAAEAYIWQQSTEVFTDHFMKEYYRFSSNTLYYSHFGIGEGYGNRSINQLLADGATTQQVTLDLPNAYANGPAAVLRTRYTAALFQHYQQLSANEEVLRTDTFYNWALQNVEMPLPQSVLTDEEARLNWEGFGGEKDEVSIGFVQVDYPAVPDAGGEARFQGRLLEQNDRQYLRINNFGATNAVVYDLANGYRIVVNNISNGILEVALPAADNPRELSVIASDAEHLIPAVSAANLNLPNLGSANYIILTNSLLRTGGDDPVQAYADYRASTAGGGYETAIVNIDHLFDQFSYGVQQHPLAIRNFVAWQRKINPAFQYLFIIGKGREYPDLRTEEALSVALGNTLFVPSFGFPASDNMLASALEKPTPLVSLGRLPAVNPAEVRLYLNKIQGMESLVASSPQTIAGKSWTKNVLHLGGGSNASEQQSIRTNLESMAGSIESGIFGGQVTSVYKSSTDPIETSQSDFIFSRINKGVSMITFFGHSSAGTFDFNIDNPDNYENLNKYPLMISLGCYSGNMFDDFRSIGERFIFLENGGAGAFGASRGLGFIHALSNFGKYFFGRMSNDLYGMPIGDGLRLTIQNYENFTDQAYGSLNEQFSLQGDPALRLNPAPGPDFIIDPGTTKFNPTVVNVQRDSFDFSFDLYNLGTAYEGEIALLIEQQLPDGGIQNLKTVVVTAPNYQDRIEVTLPTLGKPSVGLNRILVWIDPENNIAESPLPGAEANNDLQQATGELGVPLFVVDNTALPVWPPEFGITGSDPLKLRAYTSNVLAGERTYVLELDTTLAFENVLATTTVTQIGGVIEWNPGVDWQDSTVYYWRVAPRGELGDSILVWENSSFTYLNDIDYGFGQGHWEQWPSGEYASMASDSTGGFDFQSQLISVRIRNKIWDNDDRPGLVFNNSGFAGSVRPWNYLDEGLAVVVSTPNTASFWRNPPDPDVFSAGDYGVPTGNSRVFAFPMVTLSERENLIEFLEEVVPDSFYVFLFTIYDSEDADIHASEWANDSLSIGTNLFQYLEGQGANDIRQLGESGTIPYTFMYQKNIGPLGEVISPAILGEVNLEINLPRTFQEGQYLSPVFGPVAAWEELNYGINNVQLSDTSTFFFLAGATRTTLDSITAIDVDATGSIDLNALGLSAYPYLQVGWSASDFENRTLADLDHWHLLGAGLPDIALNPSGSFFVTGDSLQQGELFQFRIGLTNISDTPLTDSFTLRYTWIQDGGITETVEERSPSLGSGEQSVWELELDTKPTHGSQQLILTANPEENPREIYRFNNTASYLFHLANDYVDPTVNLTFDGIKILEGDLVSANPQIIMEIVDENHLLLLDDPDLFDIEITFPDGQRQSITSTMENVQFVAATNPEDNRAQMYWNPELIQDGIYQLAIKAKDASGNTAGRLLAETSFEVINEQLLSNILPYPNPFTTQTRFVYTLSGSEELSEIRIQIMTASGRIVREIDHTELGPFKVGTHMTEYAWDGKDQYGDQLANGVYFYNVTGRKANGDTVELYSHEQRDRFFSGGLGKIVLLR